jgi:uncharacterized BrkB/YihY/UPF0761 family membrane protein
LVQRTRQLAAQGTEVVGTVRRWVERTILWRVWERMLENEFVDRSVALGAKAFVSFFPAVIVLASFAPTAARRAIGDTVVRHAGLAGSGLVTFNEAFASSDSIRRATGIVGLIFTLFYVNSFTAALQRVYLRAWRRPRARRVSSYALGAVWLIGFVIYMSLIGGLRRAFSRGPELAAFGLIALAGGVALWWITPWAMLGRQVRLRVLFPNGLLTGLALLAYSLAASLWMPRAVSQNQDQFGFFGVALSMVTWLSGASLIVVACACAAAVLAEDDGVIGRLVRGADPRVLAPGAPPSSAPPLRAPTLTDAIGANADRDDPD